jgi:AcrR family transcriptional regulator
MRPASCVARADALNELRAGIDQVPAEFGVQQNRMPRPKQRARELRDRVLQVAVSTLNQDGLSGFTTRRVAEQAGTSVPAVYELFGDKSGLLRAVFFEAFRMLSRQLLAVPETDDAVADVQRLIPVFRRFCLDSQAFCSALPVAYSPVPQSNWETFARLILEAAYEATVLAAIEQSAAGTSNTVLLTRLGGGAFVNADAWIDDAITRSLATAEHAGLDVRLVSYGHVEPSMQSIANHWNR